MKKNEIPQDPSALDNVTKDVCYVVDESGNYTTALSRGWEVKATALDLAWSDIDSRINDAWQQYQAGKASPVLYFMEKKLMDLQIVAAYTGFWQWQIKRHIKPHVFKNLSDKKLAKYAALYEITIDELKNPKPDAD